MTTKVNYRMIEDAPVNVKDFGAKGDGVVDDTDAIELALETNRPVYIPEGTYIIRGGQLYTRPDQKLTGAGIGKTVLKLKDNAGTDRLTMLEMSSRSSVIDIELDGNYQNNISDMGSWVDVQGAPFAQGLANNRYTTNGNVVIRAEEVFVDRVYAHDTIRSCFLIGGFKAKYGTIYAHNSAADHHIYYSGAVKATIDTAYCSGETVTSSIACSTPVSSVCEECSIDNLYMTDILESEWSRQRDELYPLYINFRAWTIDNSLNNFHINRFVVDDEATTPYNTKRILVERNWQVSIDSLSMKVRNTPGLKVLDVNNGRLSCGSVDIALFGDHSDSSQTQIVTVSSDDQPTFKTSLYAGYMKIDCYANLNPNLRILTCAGARVVIDTAVLRMRQGLVARISAGTYPASVQIGAINQESLNYTSFVNATNTLPNVATLEISEPTILSTTSNQPTLTHHNFVVLSHTTPSDLFRFDAPIDGWEFTVVGNGITTLQNTSLLKMLSGTDELSIDGRYYKFRWSNGVSYQIG